MDFKTETDLQNLSTRLMVNRQGSKRDLNEWIFSLVPVAKDAAILDFCCGEGSQTIPYATRASQGKVYAVDISADSLAVIDKKGMPNIQTILMDIDSFPKAPWKESYFDIIQCVYALYYSKSPEKIIHAMRTLIKPGGLLCIAGPTDENNKELFDFIQPLYPIDPYILFSSRDYFKQTVLPVVTSLFSTVRTEYFHNEVTFPDAKSLASYLKSSTMFNKEHEASLDAAIENYFQHHSHFVNRKIAMAILAQP